MLASSSRRVLAVSGQVRFASGLLGVLAALLIASSRASAETIGVPSNAATGAGALSRLAGASCPATGDCVAVGLYKDSTSHYQGLIEGESNGSWTPLEAPTTGLGATGAGLEAVACPSVGNCVAVGGYNVGPSDQEGLIETETNGSWASSRLPLTGLGAGSNPQVDLLSVSCTGVGNCVAVGVYSDPGGHEEALIATDTDGTWTTTKADVSAIGGNSNPSVQLNSVACASTGNCAAVGYYEDSSNNFQGLIETESGGTWTASKADLSKLPSVATNPNVQLTSVTCPAAGGCTAVGRYLDASSLDGSNQAMMISSSNSAWGPAREATLPANANFTASTRAQENLNLDSVSCASVGYCTAVGSYDATSANDMEALAVSESAGTWGTGAEVSPPGPAASNPSAQLNSIICTQSGCTSLGTYLDSGGSTEVWVLAGDPTSNGAAGSSVPVITGVESDGMAVLACSPDGYCAAAGYASTISGSAPFLLDPPRAVSGVSASVSGTSALVSWSAPADDGGLPLTGYTVTANDTTVAGRGGQTVTVGSGTSATVTGLTQGDTYTFTVTPTGLLGNGLTATSPAVQVPIPPQQPTPVSTPQASITTQQLTASLTGLLAPHGAGARLKRLRKTHAYTFLYKPLESGTVSVRWYEITGHRKHRHRHLVASGSATTTATTPVSVHVRLTSFGRHAIKTRHRLKLTAIVTFVAGTVNVTSKRTFTLH